MKHQIPNILVVDDVVANLVVLGDIIRAAGYNPRPVTSVVQAQKAIDACIPDLILLDISMPETDGFEFCRKLKAEHETKDIPIVFISARNATQDKIKAFELGAVDYISKPFETSEVTHRIATHLKLYSMQNQLEAYNKKLNNIINQQMKTIAENQKKVIYTLTKVLGLTCKESELHLSRTSKLCRLVALSLDCLDYKGIINHADFAHTIEVAAPLHNIGSIARYQHSEEGIYVSPTEEKDDIWSDTEYGVKVLNQILKLDEDNVFITMAMEMVASRYEKWDGSGGPKGLVGEHIPLSARILAIVDTYDVLRSEKQKQSLTSSEESMTHIMEESGKSFDPFIVKVFNQLEPQFSKYYE